MQFIWDVQPTFELFGLTLRYYTVWFAALFVLGYVPLYWQLRRGEHTDPRDGDYLVVGAVAGVILGGRLAHLLFYETANFYADPLVFFDFSRGGLASHGSVVGLLIAVAAVAKVRDYPLVDFCDRVTFSAMIGAICVRFGNFFNSEIVGRVTDQSWGVRFVQFDGADGPFRHPSQLYEAALAAVALVVLIAIDRRFGEERPTGLLVSVVFVIYFGGRFFLEFFKEYQAFAQGAALTMGQWLSLPAALIGVAGIAIALRRAAPHS